jgi:hypothetical protein
MPANDNSDSLCCATVDALAPDDFGAAPPQVSSRAAPRRAKSAPDPTCRVVDNLPEIIAVTAKELAAIEMFLGASLDRLLSD